MKKWFALLICALLIMMACAAFAETTVYEPIEYTVTDTGADSETLFERYVDALFTGKRARMVTGNRLTGIEATIYQALAKQVVAVAEGSLSSTVFEFPVEEIFPVTRWTKKDLGTEIIVNGGISSEAMEKARSSISYDISLVNRALLADYPYEMYWYDKTSGCTVSGYGYSSNGEELWITGAVTFSYTVAGEFAAGTYAVNSTPALTAQTAAENAKAIVRKYASLSDYEKLAAYKQEICDLVDYNHDAADNGAPYGNPWQLIWVFDGDPATKVVCEGYSKAFQYLCDMSTFTSGTDCYTVSGVMGGGTGAGRHMWNIVAMDDGRRYLVDITNSDEGSVGQNGGLFLNAFDSLDMTQGYTYQCENGAVSYIYDEAMLSLFTDAELAMSADDYDPNHEPVYTPSPEPMITETPTPTATPEPEWSTPTPYWDDPTPTPLWEEPSVEPTEMPTPMPTLVPTMTPYPTPYIDGSDEEFTVYIPTVEGYEDAFASINGGAYDEDEAYRYTLRDVVTFYDPLDKTDSFEIWYTSGPKMKVIADDVFENHYSGDDGYYKVRFDIKIDELPTEAGDAKFLVIWKNAKGNVYAVKNITFHIVPLDLPTKLYNVPEIINLRKGYRWEIWGALEFTDEDVMWDCFDHYQEVTITGDGWQDYVAVYTDIGFGGAFSIHGLEVGTAEFDVNIYIAGSDFCVTQHMKVNVREPETLTLPASTIRIEDGAFQNTAIDRVVIPEGCVSIGSKAFANCENLWDVHIPASVTYIAPDAFEGSKECYIEAPMGSYAIDYADARNLPWYGE